MSQLFKSSLLALSILQTCEPSTLLAQSVPSVPGTSSLMKMHSALELSSRWHIDMSENRYQSYGRNLCVGPDINNDGIGDVFVGAPEYSDCVFARGLVDVLDGDTGALVRRTVGSSASERWGSGIVRAEDADGDSVDDIIILSSSRQPMVGKLGDSVQENIKVTLVSARSGNSIFEVQLITHGYSTGRCLAAWNSGREDGDSRIWVGGPKSNGGAGAFWALSPKGLSEFYKVEGGPGSRLGTSLAVGSDVDSDGIPEIAVGMYGSGSVGCYSGLDGSRKWQATFAGCRGIGGTVIAVGDVTEDGISDFASVCIKHGESHKSIIIIDGANGGLVRYCTLQGSATDSVEIFQSNDTLDNLDGTCFVRTRAAKETLTSFGIYDVRLCALRLPIAKYTAVGGSEGSMQATHNRRDQETGAIVISAIGIPSDLVELSTNRIECYRTEGL